MANSNEYMRDYMLRRYHRRKAEAIKRLGGACAKCGSKKDLEFDHKTQRGDTDFVIGKRLAGVAEDKFDAELKKCQLLCKDCHNIKTQKEIGQKVAKGTHGTLSAYRHCGPPKCEPCKKAKRLWMREWRMGP